MRSRIALAFLSLFVMVVAGGCSSTKITSRDELVTQKLPRPAHIWVYDFAATSADVPADSALAGEDLEAPSGQTAEHIATGRELGAQIASELIAEIRKMGLPAEQGVTGTTPSINDIVIRGYLLSVETGSAAERVKSGGRRLPDDASGVAQTRVRHNRFQRKQNARGGLGACRLNCHTQPGRAHRQQCGESVWGRERPEQG